MNFPSVSQFSIAKGTGGTNPPEMYIELFWYSGGSASVSTATSAGNSFVAKGSTGTTSSSSSSAKLHTLNSSWYLSNKYAFEACLNTGNTMYAELWDLTSGSAVSGSQISSSSTYSIVRSGQFTLTPGHVYGITFWSANSTYGAGLIDASLIVFPS